MEHLTAYGVLGALIGLVLLAAVRSATRRGRAEERAAAGERDVEDYKRTTEAVLNEKAAADELSARERLLARRTRKP
jgi:hypothetical protein